MMHNRPKMNDSESYVDYLKRTDYGLWNQTFNDPDGMEIYDMVKEEYGESLSNLSYEEFEESIPGIGQQYIKAAGDGNNTQAMIFAMMSHICNELNEDHFRTYNNK